MQTVAQPNASFDLIFGALADATRRDIVRRAIHGTQGVAELAEHYPMSFAAVQKHVAILERAGLVGKHQSGRRKVVRTEMGTLLIAQGLLKRYEELWQGRFERMSRVLDETDTTADANPEKEIHK
jgi:DNA-binding transcriptional ArsR family regulator